MATENDKDILNHIFNPLLPMGELSFDNDDNGLDEMKGVEDDESENSKLAKAFELEGVKAAGEEDYEKSLKLFTTAIEVSPLRASGYNNRAQSYRLLGNVAAAKIDLNNAINLSNGQGRAACQAFCQRGLINLKENKEEEARADFEAAAALGSQFAKAQLVQLNPYAALCNKMLNSLIGKLQRGESEEYKDTNRAEK